MSYNYLEDSKVSIGLKDNKAYINDSTIVRKGKVNGTTYYICKDNRYYIAVPISKSYGINYTLREITKGDLVEMLL